MTETDPQQPIDLQPSGTIESNQSQAMPKLFLYSILVPVIWFTLGFIALYAASGKSLGMFGLVIVLQAALGVASWHLARNYRRELNLKEKVRLAVYCTIWAVLSESLALFSLLTSGPESSRLSTTGVVTVLIVTFSVDALFASLSVFISMPRMVRFFLERQVSENSGDLIQGPSA